MPVTIVKTSEEFNTIINGPNTNAVIVDWTASWCGPCQMIKPIFEKLSNEFTTIKFISVDVDELEDIAASAEIAAMPTFQVYKNGAKVETLVGATKEGLEQLVSQYV